MLNEESGHDRTPFRSTLVESGVDPKIKALSEDPNTLIRPGLSERIELRYKDTMDTPKIREKYRVGKEGFLEMRDKYGFNIPRMDLVVGKDTDGRDKMFVVTDRVVGKDFKAILQENEPGMVEKTQKLFEGLADYFVDKGRTGGVFFDDINLSQFVYGRREGEAEDKFYLVDLDPIFSRFDTTNYRNPLNVSYFSTLNTFEFMLRDAIEPKMGEEAFKVTRDKISSFLDTIPPENPLYRMAQGTLKGYKKE